MALLTSKNRVPIDESELREGLLAHRLWVESNGSEGAVADFSGRAFHGVNLRGADLRLAILERADLRRADLKGANLLGANLRWGDLRGANLIGADLTGADLFAADVRRAALRGVLLRGANLALARMDRWLVRWAPFLAVALVAAALLWAADSLARWVLWEGARRALVTAAVLVMVVACGRATLREVSHWRLLREAYVSRMGSFEGYRGEAYVSRMGSFEGYRDLLLDSVREWSSRTHSFIDPVREWSDNWWPSWWQRWPRYVLGRLVLPIAFVLAHVVAGIWLPLYVARSVMFRYWRHRDFGPWRGLIWDRIARHLATGLQGLDLSGLGLTNVPAAVGRMHWLRSLDLSDNRLTELPQFLNGLPLLGRLTLVGNPELGLPEEVIGSRSAPEILGYYFRRRAVEPVVYASPDQHPFTEEVPERLLAVVESLTDRYLARRREADPGAWSDLLGPTTPDPKWNVVGVGAGERLVAGRPAGSWTATLLVRRKFPAGEIDEDLRLPREVEGFRTDVIETGLFILAAGATPINPRNLLSPAQPGCSIGPDDASFTATAGTFGAVVHDRQRSGPPHLLSAAHVMTDFGKKAQDDLGIWQPSLLDGQSREQAPFARLRYWKLWEDWPRGQLRAVTLDAAVAEILAPGPWSGAILEIGTPSSTRKPSVRLEVWKFGRSTRLTAGKVIVPRVNLSLVPPPSTGRRELTLKGQMLIEGLDMVPFAEPGDSGALVVEAASTRAVGLLVAGNQGGRKRDYAVATPIGPVLDALGMDL
jgi:Pentapeptide repeats (8 copies)